MLFIARCGRTCDSAPDIVVECVVRPGMIDHRIPLIRPRVKVVALDIWTVPDQMDSFRAISREVTILKAVFFSGSTSSPIPSTPWSQSASSRKIAQATAS
ncbi:hypothetical protein [Agrobacterium tumefaciens]|uniref:hypothetical protein n=1 Tax=Agrobacterium tumefaciens TaxID=358 RepID=UPI000DD2BEBA|nr:hypothetical protein [Agrobacterium tumefaciens]MDP9789007.1 hypothetical protein [Agrobacterium tumefaciens]MDP9855306.1 hypothetical protein [Agrobacterium tumefaciens]